MGRQGDSLGEPYGGFKHETFIIELGTYPGHPEKQTLGCRILTFKHRTDVASYMSKRGLCTTTFSGA